MNLRPPPRRVLVLVAVVAAVGAGVGLAANDGSPTSKQVVSPTTAVAAHVQPNAQQRRLGNQGPPMTFAPRGDLLGPTGGDLSAAEIGIAQTAFENDAFLRSMFRQANISDPEILYIHRVALNPTEAKNPVGEGSIAAVYTREQRDFVIPSGRNIVLWDTRNVRSSRPEGYDVGIGGRRSAHGRAVSIWVLSASSVVSSDGRTTSWMEIGIPVRSRPHGTTAAG